MWPAVKGVPTCAGGGHIAPGRNAIMLPSSRLSRSALPHTPRLASPRLASPRSLTLRIAPACMYSPTHSGTRQVAALGEPKRHDEHPRPSPVKNTAVLGDLEPPRENCEVDDGAWGSGRAHGDGRAADQQNGASPATAAYAGGECPQSGLGAVPCTCQYDFRMISSEALWQGRRLPWTAERATPGYSWHSQSAAVPALTHGSALFPVADDARGPAVVLEVT